jgi:signal peptidase II
VILIAILACTTGFDQASKEWARDSLTVGQPKPVIDGMWDWELAYNTGAAFSSFEGAQILLSLIACLALVALGVMAHRTRPEQHLKRIALAVIAGGAVGNLIDRIRDGAVTDFVRWRYGEHAWPIFNVADVALVIGVMLYLLDGLLERRRAAPA